jgi:hypothetical protein
MSEAWKADLKDSVKDFRDQVAPVIEEWTDGRNVSVEAVTDDEMAEELDQTAGVDSWNVKHDDIVRGVASRVQYLNDLPYDTPPDTFTIRKERQSGAKTEFEKRLHAIRKGGLYPHWTTQAYLDEPGGELLSIGRVRTKDLIEYIEDGSTADDDYWVVEPEFEASFYAVYWWRLEDIGIGVRTRKPYETEKRVEVKVDNGQSGLGDFIADGGKDQ